MRSSFCLGNQYASATRDGKNLRLVSAHRAIHWLFVIDDYYEESQEHQILDYHGHLLLCIVKQNMQGLDMWSCRKCI